MQKQIVLITRPEPVATQMANDWRAAGFESIIEPLINITFTTKLIFDPLDYDLIIVTSAMAIRALSSLTSQRDFSLWCVGGASKNLANELGFSNVYSPSSSENAQTLIEEVKIQITFSSKILYLAGDITKVDVKRELEKEGFKIDKDIVYHSIPQQSFSLETLSLIQKSSKLAITFYSARTFEIFYALCQHYGILDACAQHIALCLSEEIAKKVGIIPWQRIITASTTANLIANLKELS